MRRTLVILFCLICFQASARFPHGAIVNGFGTLKVGGGGFTTGMQICADGTMVSRTNTAGAYVATISSSVWANLLTTASLPNTVYSLNGGNSGVSEIQAACSNTQTLYMAFNGYRLKSTNQGGSWTNLSAWTHNNNENANSGPNGVNGTYGPLIAVDPNDPSTMVTGSAGIQLYYTTNGGIAFTGISTATIAAPTVNNGPILIQYQPGSSSVLWACSWGNQCYHTSGGPAGSWSQTSGGPTTYYSMRVDSAGVVWVTDVSTNVWRYNGSWTNVLSQAGSNFYGLTVGDPNNAAHVWAITYNGDVNYSADTGATWSGVNGTTGHIVTASDVPWLASNRTNQTDMSAAGYAVFDPTGTGKTYVSAGTGVFKATLPTVSVASATVTWDSVTAQQESIVATAVLSPKGGQINMFGWDRPGWKSTNPKAYPSHQSYDATASSIMGSWGADFVASAPDTMVALITNNGGGAGACCFLDMSGISTDGGSTWTPFGVAVTSSIANGTGSRTICPGGVGTGCANMHNLTFTNGDLVQVYEASDYTQWFNGSVTSYNSSTGELVLNVSNSTFPGTISDWLVHTTPPIVITGMFGGCIAAADTAHFLWVPSKNATSPYYTIDGGKSWNPVLISGIPTTGTTGWGSPANNGGSNGCQVTADKVLTDTFYLVNTSTQPGIYTCTTSSGLSCSRTATSIPAAAGGTTRIKAVPGKSGHLYYSGGVGSSNLMHSTDGGANWNAVVNGANHFNNVQAFCLGATYNGQSYPSLYVIGDPDTGVNNLGVYGSQDGGTTWSLLTQWMNNNPDLPFDCAGDPVTPGYFYVGFGGSGSGFAYYGAQ